MPSPSSMTLFANAMIVDGQHADPVGPFHVLVDGEVIRQVSDKPIKMGGARTIDLKGGTLMPGLIDAHVHVVAFTANIGANAGTMDSLVAAHAARIMRDMLHRGFTTVRDVGGADSGLVRAVEQGLFEGPRLVISGKALSQSGGHCDARGSDDDTPYRFPKRLGSLGRLCDGMTEVRRAAREELKSGADFIKIMANGGVASPTDPIHFLGFSREEIAAIVEEAKNAGTYVSAHLYTDEAIRRCVELGVHSLEHCNLIKLPTAKLAAKMGCFAVPTLVTYDALAREGTSHGLPPISVSKIETVRSKGMESLEIMKKAGLQMAYGSDLLGDMHRHQSDEFQIRGRVLPAHEVIASATSIAAKLLRMEGRIGVIAPGAFADLIVVEGNPLKDLSLLAGQDQHMPVIMKGGAFIKGG
jgi:imidazolonepropionase-like amidohydrolase